MTADAFHVDSLACAYRHHRPDASPREARRFAEEAGASRCMIADTYECLAGRSDWSDEEASFFARAEAWAKE